MSFNVLIRDVNIRSEKLKNIFWPRQYKIEGLPSRKRQQP